MSLSCADLERKLTIDLWAVGCIYAELLSLRPIFKGEEAKLDSKKTLPFQRDQMAKICDVLGAVKRKSHPPSPSDRSGTLARRS